MEIILSILCVFSWMLILSTKVKKPENPITKLKEELKFVDLDSREINDILENYKNSLAYKRYELNKAYFELGQSIKKTLKK